VHDLHDLARRRSLAPRGRKVGPYFPHIEGAISE
jgi:hypothetical protein